MKLRITDMFPHLWDVRLQWCASHPGNDAVPMTKAETIMRREEAVKMRWPLIMVDVSDVGKPRLYRCDSRGQRSRLKRLDLSVPGLRPAWPYCHE